MATLPGMPDLDEPESGSTLPIEPEFAPQLPPPLPADPGHQLPEPDDT